MGVQSSSYSRPTGRKKEKIRKKISNNIFSIVQEKCGELVEMIKDRIARKEEK